MNHEYHTKMCVNHLPQQSHINHVCIIIAMSAMHVGSVQWIMQRWLQKQNEVKIINLWGDIRIKVCENSYLISNVQLAVFRHDKIDETIEGILVGHLFKRNISKKVYKDTKPLGYFMLKT